MMRMGMMRSQVIARVTHEELLGSAFDGWWNPVEKLIGCVEWGPGKVTFIAQTLPWDGAMGGRLDTSYATRTPKIRNGLGISLAN